MIVAKLSIKYDRGLAYNKEEDLGVDGSKVAPVGFKLAGGEIIRGLGTKWRSEGDKESVQAKDKEARRIYSAFRERFLSTPIDGLYAVPGNGIAKRFLESLDVQLGLNARVTELELTTSGDLDAAEIMEWSKKIKNQLTSVRLGRGKEIDANGLDALLTLASSPLLSQNTSYKIKSLVELVKSSKIERLDLHRQLGEMTVEIEQAPLAPRRMPSLAVAA